MDPDRLGCPMTVLSDCLHSSDPAKEVALSDYWAFLIFTNSSANGGTGGEQIRPKSGPLI